MSRAEVLEDDVDDYAERYEDRDRNDNLEELSVYILAHTVSIGDSHNDRDLRRAAPISFGFARAIFGVSR
jgi:hypothetical protein